jgi:hypothetical protein
MYCCYVFYPHMPLYTRLYGPVRTGTENFVPIGIRTPDHPAHSESLSQPTVPQRITFTVTAVKYIKMSNGQSRKNTIHSLISLVHPLTNSPDSSRSYMRQIRGRLSVGQRTVTLKNFQNIKRYFTSLKSWKLFHQNYKDGLKRQTFRCCTAIFFFRKTMRRRVELISTRFPGTA